MEKLKFLQNSPLFIQCDPGFVETFSGYLKEEKVSRGETPYNSGHTIRNFYLIGTGRLKLFQIDEETGREYTLYLLSAGDCFDILTLLDGQRHEIMTEALDDSVICSIPIDRVRDFIRQYDQFNANFFRYLALRVRRLETAAVDNVLSDTIVRLAKLIFVNISDDGNRELRLINNLSHEELAKIIGTTGAVVNRHLQTLKQEGIIEIERKRLLISDLALLKSRYLNP